MSSTDENAKGKKSGSNSTTYSNIASTISSAPSVSPLSTTELINANTITLNTTNTVPGEETKKLENWDDGRLKELLEEAYSYKNPIDKENKSEIFLQLLNKVEKEEDRRHRRDRRDRNSSHRSLQDLVESLNHDSLIDYDFTSGNKNRRHPHTSRHKKNSSVSSRQREGGSLPSNVNVSNCNLSVYEESPFLNEVVNKRRGKNERTCSGTSGSSVSTCGYESLNSTSSICKDFEMNTSGGIIGGTNNCTNNSGDAIIDIGEQYSDEIHLLSKDSMQKGCVESMDVDDYEDVKRHPRMVSNQVINNRLDFSASEPKSYVDEPIRFASLESGGKLSADATACVSLDEKYPSCKSILGEKSELGKQQQVFTTTKNIPKQFDENGNSLNTPYNSGNQQTSIASQSQAKTKKKKPQSERNTTTINVQKLDGFRGDDPVDDLVKYIENDKKEESSSNNNNKKFDKSAKLNDTNKNKKDRKKDKEKDVKKLKKSNSLEELRSCTKLDEDDQKLETNIVQMRNKNKQNTKSNNCASSSSSSSSSNSSCTTVNANNNDSTILKDSKNLTNHKRGERRSWGTEELTYLGENNAIEEVREKVKEKEKKKTKDSNDGLNLNIPTTSLLNNIGGTNDKLEKNDNKKKKDDETTASASGGAIVSTETLQYEAAGFHVVTKKKKSKKRQSIDNNFNNQNNNFNSQHNRYQFSSVCGSNHNPANKSYKDNNHNKRYTTSSNFANDRDVYIRSDHKSTSSMPPSEKSSDLESDDEKDSVHSLPTESTSRNFSSTSSSHTTSESNNKNSSGNKNSNNSPSNAKSYADMARFNIYQIKSSISTKLNNDKWPVVSTGTNSSNETSTNVKTYSNNKKIKHDFPDLLNNPDTINNNEASNATKSQSQHISYSQSLVTNDENVKKPSVPTSSSNKNIGDKLTNAIINKVNKQNNNSSPTSSTNSSNNNNNNNVGDNSNTSKQTLQKSKSVENEVYYNSMDQYPALEKTVKRHNTNATLITTNPTQISTQTLQSKNPALNTITNIKQQNTSIPTPAVIFNNTAVTANMSFIQQPQQPHVILMHPTPLPLPSLSSNTIKVSSDNISDIVVNNNNNNNIYLPINDNTASNINLVNSTSLSSFNSSTIKKSKQTNAKVSTENSLNDENICISNESGIVNVDNSQQIHINLSSNIINGRKKPRDKVGLQQHQNDQNQQKVNQNIYNNQDNNSQITNLNAAITSLSLSSRPAVIILNDDSAINQQLTFPYTFGDFNEEELRFYSNTNNSNDIVNNGEIPININEKYINSKSTSSSNLEDSSGHFSFGSIESENVINEEPSLSSIPSNNCNALTQQLNQQQQIDNIENNNLSTSSDYGYRSHISDDNSANDITEKLSSTLKLEEIIDNEQNIDEYYTENIDIVSISNTDTGIDNTINPYIGKTNKQQQQINQSKITSKSLNSEIDNTSPNTSTSSCTSQPPSMPSVKSSATKLIDNNNKKQSNKQDVGTSTTTIVATTAAVASSGITSSTYNINNHTNINTNIENQKKTKKDVKYIAPNYGHDFNSVNFELIDFVGMSWDEVYKNAEIYDGQ